MGVPIPILDPVTAYRQRVRVTLPSQEQVTAAAKLIPAAAPARVSRFGRRYELPRWFLTVSPGTIRLSVKTTAPKEHWHDGSMEDEEHDEQVDGPTRGRISDFSRKSRSRMTDAFRSLDYAPMFEGGDFPALVTLTAPADWQTVFPTPESLGEKRAEFFQAYRKAWGDAPMAVWKLEFQERGAPHIHLLMVPPRGLSRGVGVAKGRGFREWLSIRWAQVVNHPDPNEFAKHVAAGTNVDWREGERYSDPRRIATYFDKHSGYHEKDYQNEWPRLWKDAVAAGAAGARIWGYVGLKKATETIELHREPGARSRMASAAAFPMEEPVMHRHRQPNPAVAAGLVDGYPSIMSSQTRKSL